MIAATADTGPVRRRIGWIGAFLLVLALHGAALLSLRSGETQLPDSAPPAVLIDLAPTPVTPPAPTAIPLVQPVPPDTTPPLPPFPVPPAPMQPVASVPLEEALPPPPPPAPPQPAARPAPRPPHLSPRPPLPSPSTATAPAPPASTPPTPAQAPAAPTAPSGHAGPAWPSELMARLARFRRYPPEAEQRGWRGIVTVRFAIDRQGNVLSVNVVRGSGHEVLDREAEAWVRRAEPLPKPPPEILGSTVELLLPLRFEIHDSE